MKYRSWSPARAQSMQRTAKARFQASVGSKSAGKNARFFTSQ